MASRLSDREESSTAKIVSLVIKAGALGFIVFLPTQYAINFQLLGGVWIIQTFPAIVVGLYTRWLDRWALLLGWAAGMLVGTGMAISLSFASQVFQLRLGGLVVPGYVAFYALIVNVVVSVVATLVLRALKVAPGRDETRPEEYSTTFVSEPGSPLAQAEA